MTLDPNSLPGGTIRDWLDLRAGAGGVSVVFPETGTRMTWAELREATMGLARMLTASGAAKDEGVAVMAPNSRRCALRLLRGGLWRVPDGDDQPRCRA
ncbi:hypothetical protein RA2_02320 [Roseovarius sp. A-2]|uniref:AMP-binding protein n=1 Tax=Roseovarius sp. A-2 TaxID=1570360 RepID=UPI0009B592CB|nr:AMP-binding protein [Roseovarius sp. A-2]GAW35260.1 hypothetical protein RA2_02320 [Roseovarius sp. A-2]